MDDITARERLPRVLSGQPVDRPPVVCSGGMVYAAVTEVTSSRAAAKRSATWSARFRRRMGTPS